MARKHVRTRQSHIHFARNVRDVDLLPGIYRIGDGMTGHYVGSFEVKKDRTVEFYGARITIDRDGDASGDVKEVI